MMISEHPTILDSPAGGSGIGGGHVARLRVLGRKHLRSIVAAIAAVAVVILVFQPFRPVANDGLSVADHWKKSILGLGVTAVYPPQEDFHVGDIILVVSGDDAVRDPLVGQSIRVGHVDVRQLLRASAGSRIALQRSAFGSDDTPAKQQPMTIAEDSASVRSRTTAIAFPAFQITSDGTARGLFGFQFGMLSGSRRDTAIDSIAMRGVSTYGIDAGDADGLLADWCGAAQTAKYCNGENARTLMAYLIDPSLLDRKSGRSIYGVKPQLVTRVYLARTIEHLVDQGGSRDVGAGDESLALLSGERDGESSSVEDNKNAPTNTVSGRARRGAGYGEAGSSKQSISETYEFPVVFGYRALSVMLGEKR